MRIPLYLLFRHGLCCFAISHPHNGFFGFSDRGVLISVIRRIFRLSMLKRGYGTRKAGQEYEARVDLSEGVEDVAEVATHEQEISEGDADSTLSVDTR